MAKSACNFPTLPVPLVIPPPLPLPTLPAPPTLSFRLEFAFPACPLD